MPEDAVCNSTCLIALERIGRLDLLRQSFERMWVSGAVAEEFGVRLDWLHVREVTNQAAVRALATQLGPGEAEAIALAMEFGGVTLVLDEKKARRLAARFGLKVTGAVGLLLQAKRRGVITAVAPVLDELDGVGFHLSESLRAEALRLAEE